MRNLNGGEWLIILLIVVLLFGAAKLPGLAKGLGESIRIFRKEVKTTDSKKAATKADEKNQSEGEESSK